MNIPSGAITKSIRLEKLQDQLHEFDGDYLLIFDGIDHPDTFEELKKNLPNNRRGILLPSRMSEYESQELQCKSLSLKPWHIEEAVDYLLITTESEETNHAEILAEKLGRLPLALAHASAYVSNRYYTICKYIEEFEQHSIQLLEREYQNTAKEKRAVLSTRQITLDTIEKYHKCFIAKHILNLFS